MWISNKALGDADAVSGTHLEWQGSKAEVDLRSPLQVSAEGPPVVNFCVRTEPQAKLKCKISEKRTDTKKQWIVKRKLARKDDILEGKGREFYGGS